jgi:hypothetical protein
MNRSNGLGRSAPQTSKFCIAAANRRLPLEFLWSIIKEANTITRLETHDTFQKELSRFFRTWAKPRVFGNERLPGQSANCIESSLA